MEIGINELDIDDDDVILGDEGSSGDIQSTADASWETADTPGDYTEPSNVIPDTSPVGENDLVTSLLRSKNINPDSVKLQNEKGDIEEVKFGDLSLEEQLDILSYHDVPEAPEFSSDELDFITKLRQDKLTVQDFIEGNKRRAIEEYISSYSATQEPQYQIDTMSDEELFIADLKARIPELTETEATEALSLEKQNEGLFNKKIQGIRTEYKKIEDRREQDQVMAEQERAEAEANEFRDSILEAIESNNQIDLGESSLSMSDEDMDDIASFILEEDSTGTRYIARALSDPKTLVEMVWYALKGKEALGQISEYYKGKISEVAKYNYQKGFQDSKGGKPSNPAKTTVVHRPNNNNNNNRPLSIDDIGLD